MPKGTAIEGYEPHRKLYSKCAKDHSSKNSINKSSIKTLKPNKSSIITFHSLEREKKVVSTFDMNETREQRQRKYRNTLTPAVGQYYPKINFGKPKFTWDILKVFKKRGCSRRMLNLSQTSNERSKTIQDDGEKANMKQSQIKMESDFTDSFPQDQTLNNSQNENQKVKLKTQNYESLSKRYRTVISQVDMKRTTGRKEPQKEKFNHESEISVDLNSSIKFVKISSIKKISFDQQISRKKANDRLETNFNVTSNYDYDFEQVKPKKTAFINFEKSLGRKNTLQSSSINQSNSYTHYDYDSYVWKGNSTIYGNTKTHLIGFDKQALRKISQQ